MKVLIICHSKHHGNTLKIAKVIAEVLQAEIVSPDQAPKDLAAYDLIGFGSGIYFFKHHKKLFDFVKNVPRQAKKKTFIFSTSGRGGLKFHADLKKGLEDRGFAIVKEFACKGYDTWGPFKLVGGISKGRPNETDLKSARKFAKDLTPNTTK